jgi:hypothetical protein
MMHVKDKILKYDGRPFTRIFDKQIKKELNRMKIQDLDTKEKNTCCRLLPKQYRIKIAKNSFG